MRIEGAEKITKNLRPLLFYLLGTILLDIKYIE